MAPGHHSPLALQSSTASSGPCGEYGQGCRNGQPGQHGHTHLGKGSLGRRDVQGEEQGTMTVEGRNKESIACLCVQLGQAAVLLGQQELQEEPQGQDPNAVLGSRTGPGRKQAAGGGDLLSMTAGGTLSQTCSLPLTSPGQPPLRCAGLHLGPHVRSSCCGFLASSAEQGDAPQGCGASHPLGMAAGSQTDTKTAAMHCSCVCKGRTAASDHPCVCEE